MSLNLSARIALITGANRTDGIGYALARQLALQHNFIIILGSRALSPSLDDAVKQLEKEGAKNGVHPLEIDVTSRESIRKAVKEVEDKFGRLDVLVNNAGMGVPASRTEIKQEFPRLRLKATEHTRQDFEEVFSVNVFGVVETINAFTPLLAKSVSPRIVNVSSARGSFATIAPLSAKGAGFMVYNTSKSALNMLTIMYAKDLPALNPSFKINAGCPGHCSTAFNNYSGPRTADEGAAVMTWLATLPDDGPNGGFYCDHPPYSNENGVFKAVEW